MEPRNSRRQRNAPTINDVAKHAGVSPMTVSRVINGEVNVRPGTREQVQAAIVALRYAPSSAARALAGGEEVRVGLLHSNPSFAYLSEFLVGSLDQASRSNVQLIVEKCDDAVRERDAVEHLVKGRIDGVVLPPPLCDSPAILKALHAAGVPTVTVATGKAPDWALAVTIDDHRAAHDMTTHLASLGHTRIGFVTGNPNQSASAERLAGYRAGLADSGLPFADDLVAEGLFTYRSGLDAAERLLEGAEAPTAIFASNDDMAAATVAVAHRRGLDVPGDLSVVGFDDTALATTIWPELTTIRQPIVEMSRQAVEMLVRDIRARKSGREDTAPRHVLADHTLIRRQSDAAPRRRPPARKARQEPR